MDRESELHVQGLCALSLVRWVSLSLTLGGSLCEYMGHDVSNMRGFDSYRLLTLSLAALMTRISSAMIEGAHTSAGAATLARTVPFWGRFRSPARAAHSGAAVPRVPTAECHKHCAVPPSPTGCLV